MKHVRSALGGQSTWSAGRPEKPRPEEPSVVEPPRDHISVRQLMAYLCQGPTAEDGLADTSQLFTISIHSQFIWNSKGRAFAVLGPSSGRIPSLQNSPVRW